MHNLAKAARSSRVVLRERPRASRPSRKGSPRSQPTRQHAKQNQDDGSSSHCIHAVAARQAIPSHRPSQRCDTCKIGDFSPPCGRNEGVSRTCRVNWSANVAKWNTKFYESALSFETQQQHSSFRPTFAQLGNPKRPGRDVTSTDAIN
jgi:hypothetical protein